MTERSRTLAQIADDLEAIKAEMEDRGSSMTDGTPLVNIRRALARMKQEVMLDTTYMIQSVPQGMTGQ